MNIYTIQNDSRENRNTLAADRTGNFKLKTYEHMFSDA